MPTVSELATQELQKRYSYQNRTQVTPRVQTMRNEPFRIRSALSNLMRDAIDATGLEGGYRRGLLNAASDIDTAVDFVPVLGDALALEDAAKSYEQGDLVGTGINLMGVVPIIGDAGVKLSKGARSALRDQGFTEGFFHASKQDIKDGFKAGYSDGMVFVTPEREFANNWVGKGKYQKRIGEADLYDMQKADEQAVWDSYASEYGDFDNWPEKIKDEYFSKKFAIASQYRSSGGTIYPVAVKANNQFDPESNPEIISEFLTRRGQDPLGTTLERGKTDLEVFQQGNYLLFENKEMADFLKEKGYDSVWLREDTTRSGLEKPFSTLAILDETGVKPVYDFAREADTAGSAVNETMRTAKSSLNDLYFLHNTTPEALARYDDLGGLPAPSIAVTQQDIPFENFGDITLVGRPDRFAPEADKANTVWGSDAYTVRAPKAFRIPSSDAKDNFLKDFKNIEQSDKFEAEYLIDELSRKPSNPAQLYGEFDSWLESRNDALRKFAKDNDISVSKDAGWADLRQIREDNREAFNTWKQGEINKYFEPELYFDASSKNSSRVNIKPYTNEYIIPYMKRSSGAGTEQTSTVGVGKIRSALQPRLGSLEEIRSARGSLADDIAESNVANENLLIDFQNALEPYYKWPDGGWQMRDDVGTALSNSGRIGMRSALEKEGFENVPDSLVDELSQFTNDLVKSPTNYFESKPMRQVGFEEFSGALVPINTPQSSLRLLESKGIPYTMYNPESPADRLAARKSFKDSAFILGGLGVGTGAYQAAQTEQQPDI